MKAIIVILLFVMLMSGCATTQSFKSFQSYELQNTMANVTIDFYEQFDSPDSLRIRVKIENKLDERIFLLKSIHLGYSFTGNTVSASVGDMIGSLEVLHLLPPINPKKHVTIEKVLSKSTMFEYYQKPKHQLDFDYSNLELSWQIFFISEIERVSYRNTNLGSVNEDGLVPISNHMMSIIPKLSFKTFFNFKK